LFVGEEDARRQHVDTHARSEWSDKFGFPPPSGPGRRGEAEWADV